MLFNMLQKKRVDAFPRAVVEVWSEIDANENKFAVESGLVIHYPAAIYFFVHKNNQALASAITEGLEEAYSNGSFDMLFWRYHRQAIERSALHERLVVSLQNSNLPEATPLQRKSLWFDPVRDYPVY